MPTQAFYNRDILLATTTSRRWSGLTRFTTDLATLRTWDTGLSRLRRILVPIDVQAYVSDGASESVTALSGTSADPAPFDPGAPLPAGVHLHWAMPDALLRGRAAEDGEDLQLPRLPDRWVVIRSLLYAGARTITTAGWVVDSAAGTLGPLQEFTGTARQNANPAVTGSSGGSLLWSASYHGSAGRHALHDPLTDLADDRAAVERAAYTVAGWWSLAGEDPLTGGSWGLLRRMAELDWALTTDGEDRLREDQDPRELRLAAMSGATSDSDRRATTTVTKYSRQRALDGDTAPRVSVPFDGISQVVVGAAATRYATLLHGSVCGVPITGQGGRDEAPAGETLGAAIGHDVDDLAAAFAAPSLGSDAESRLTGERLLAAFTGNLLAELGDADGLDSLEEREHRDTFDSAPGPPLEQARADTVRVEDSLARGPLSVGRKGRTATASPEISTRLLPEQRLDKRGKLLGWNGLAQASAPRSQPKATARPVVAGATASASGRERVRPAPRIFRPAPPMIGLRGVKPHPRHHGDGLYDDAGMLRCRYPGEAVPGIDGTIEGALILPSLGSGAIPPEVVSVVRETTLLDPWADEWLAAATARPAVEIDAVRTRLRAERVRMLGTSGTYDPSGRVAVIEGMTVGGGVRARAQSATAYDLRSPLLACVAGDLARFSFIRGTPPSPVGITFWRQPWIPIWLEWQVTLRGTTSLDSWQLQGRDLTGSPKKRFERTVTGRTPLSRGVGKALTEAIRTWLTAENERDLASPSSSVLSDPDEAVLDTLASLLGPLDVVSASLDGVRENLLGIDYQSLLTMTAPDETSEVKPQAASDPVPLFGGTITVDALRVVDAFGRYREVPVTQVATTTVREVPDEPAAMALPPRLQHGGRWLFRLVDPAHGLASDPASAPEAFVNQVAPELTVNPVSGFLLPDHIDESVEVFDATGMPLGEVGHDPLTGAVTWDPAPGRPLPPDASPLDGIIPGAQHVALLAAGLVTSDIQARGASPAPSESALTAFLRVVDTTLHSVDAYAGVGADTVAGLVGRPIAVVRAALRLQAPSDLGQVEVTAPGGESARQAAFDTLAGQRVSFRLGELARADDATLGFFVDDDYSRFHVVDKAVAAAARQLGRSRGQLGLLGRVVVPDPEALDHPYLVLEDSLSIRIGQVRSLTILMLPAGRVHLTSGILPRKALALSEDWVTPGLKRMSPSVRVGPVLVDPAQIRLPLVSTLAESQVFTRRTGGLSWRDDPITAATAGALLPPMPHEVQEGWIRVAPQEGSS